MKSIKWVVLFCIVALAGAFFSSTHLKGGGGSGDNGGAPELPRHQKKVTPIDYWEVGGKSDEQGGVISNPYAE